MYFKAKPSLVVTSVYVFFKTSHQSVSKNVLSHQTLCPVAAPFPENSLELAYCNPNFNVYYMPALTELPKFLFLPLCNTGGNATCPVLMETHCTTIASKIHIKIHI